MLVEAPVSHITNAHVSPAAGIAIEVGCIKVLKGFERCTVSSKALENKPIVFGALRKFVSRGRAQKHLLGMLEPASNTKIMIA